MECNASFTKVSSGLLIVNTNIHCSTGQLPQLVNMALYQTLQPPGFNSIDYSSRCHCFTSSLSSTNNPSPHRCSQPHPFTSTSQSQTQTSLKANELWLHQFYRILSSRTSRRQLPHFQASTRRSTAHSARPSAKAIQRSLRTSELEISPSSLPTNSSNHSR